MQQDTLVLIEKFSFITTTAVAREAIRQGYKVIAIVADTLPESRTRNLTFETVRIGDWSTASLEATVQAIEARHRVTGIGTILGFFTGQGLLGAQVAELCARRNLPHTPAAALFRANNKYIMRQTLQQAGVYTIRHARVTDDAALEEAARTVGFPLILKPVVGVGSSFISRCDNLDEMRRVYRHYLEQVRHGFYAHFFCAHEVEGTAFDPLTEMLAEEAIDGSEISVECLCTGDTIQPLVIHDKLDVEQEAYCSFENLLITPPVRLDDAAQDAVRRYTVDVLAALGLKHCFCHVELRFDSLGRPSVIEVNPRIGGMRVKDSLRTLRGIHYEQIYLQQLLGRPVTIAPAATRPGYYGMLAIYPRQSGTLTAVRGVEAARNLPGLLDIAIHVPPGQPVGGNFEEVFVVDAWLHGASPEAILHLDKQVKALVEVEVER